MVLFSGVVTYYYVPILILNICHTHSGHHTTTQPPHRHHHRTWYAQYVSQQSVIPDKVLTYSKYGFIWIRL